MMKILSRYIAVEYFRFFLLLLIAFTLITLIGNLFSQISDAFDDWAHFREFLKETALMLPSLIELITPMSVLIATIATFSALSRTSEIVAMRAAGVGFIQLATPILIMTSMISIYTYGVQHYAYNWMWERWHSDTMSESFVPLWKIGIDQTVYYFGKRYPDQTVEAVTFFRWQANPYRIIEQSSMDKGNMASDKWVFEKISQKMITGDRLKIADLDSWETSLKQLPSVPFTAPWPAHNQPFFTLYQNIMELQKEGQDVNGHWVEWYQKTAYPVSLFIMALIGIALSATHARRGGASESIAISCLLGIFFWIFNQIFLAIGSAGVVIPIIAAWTTNSIFFVIACFLFYWKRI
ncbi:MAG: LptF/LptG family permease [SAR324 cluster bacterium]|nr:LptF/LptG family permease [SAR324 cluster bacterium]